MGIFTSALLALTTAVGVQQGRQARKEQKKTNRIEEKRIRLQNRRSQIEQIRKAQIARAEIVAQGEAQGAGSSSAVQGGAGAVQSQTAGNIGFQNQIMDLQMLARRRLEKAQDFSFRGQAIQQIGQSAASAYSSSQKDTTPKTNWDSYNTQYSKGYRGPEY